MKPLHVIVSLFHYTKGTITDINGNIITFIDVREMRGSAFVDGPNVVEFGPKLSPLIATPFGCYQMAFWCHDCSKIHEE
ncbi:hypothetical protein HWB90_gp052 [Mycobacterium phage Fowlmouth]|uniref:Uncharacterized protein n=2 Tax=Fowlmouthvirus fowlmouth TaxID=2845652 RepID=A0A7G8LPU3_9CAUD|nr:hypothetical protein HWB90_gp052 [Mycobacterium phage Fowlmouth]AYN58002.1 hypothetical protein SEA_FOWLMOUTH_52 [Mycobacterium phage Fowlmouth]QNJ59265.1 hypothetical protein SEA_MRMIYAGI_51 [Mycobacterium phage MrMiyagi]